MNARLFALAAILLGVSPAFRDVRRAPLDPVRVARGAKAIEAAQCNKCHAGTGLPELATRAVGESCTGCHRWIHDVNRDPVEREVQAARFPLWSRYEDRVKHFVGVPDLAASGARLDPDWIARYVRAPHKVRPGMTEEMIRTPLTEEDATAIAARLASARPAHLSRAAEAAAAIAPNASRVAAGRALYDSLHCAACHAFGERAAEPGIAAAPDLALARERMRARDIAAFIADPDSFGVTTAMPSFALSAADAAALRDYVVFAGVVPRAARDIPGDLPVLDRAVPWKDVNDRIFGATCVHCHMDEEASGGDGGAGNTGGLGYAGTGLSFETWDGVVRGAVGPDGKRVSILEARSGAEPILLERLRARYSENVREWMKTPVTGGAPAMPLGLPALSAQDFQLLRSWIAQGAPGPDGTLAVRAMTPRQRKADAIATAFAELPAGLALTCAALPPPKLKPVAVCREDSVCETVKRGSE